MEWRDISTAQDDDVPVLVYDARRGEVHMARWMGDAWCDPVYFEWSIPAEDVTHWMPLPSPPKLETTHD